MSMEYRNTSSVAEAGAAVRAGLLSLVILVRVLVASLGLHVVCNRQKIMLMAPAAISN